MKLISNNNYFSLRLYESLPIRFLYLINHYRSSINCKLLKRSISKNTLLMLLRYSLLIMAIHSNTD